MYGTLTVGDWRDVRDALTQDLAASTAQIAQYDQQRQALRTEVEQLDAESVVLREMTALRAMIAGEAQQNSGSVDAFRATLRRLFGRFELAPPGSFWRATASADGVLWVGRTAPSVELGDQTYTLIPYVRAEAID